MLNALVIVWRESLEAMLVIGILAAWSTGRGALERTIAILDRSRTQP